jgi:hypothetical protein
MGDWKGIRNGLGEPLQLYNLKADLQEKNDVAARFGDIVAELEAKMKSCRADSDKWVPKKGKK